jgi:transcriptional regulator with XRE-family HTH domain
LHYAIYLQINLLFNLIKPFDYTSRKRDIFITGMIFQVQINFITLNYKCKPAMKKFPERLKQILKYKNITGSELAAALDIQKSSVSHLLSGRNKPGFDFLAKFTQNFPEINISWLLTGNGEMLLSSPAPDEKEKKSGKENFSGTVQLEIPFGNKTVEIIKVYADGTFEILKSRN